MSDLSELRERLHMDVERVIGAAAIVELDADAMREAIIEALEIYAQALSEAKAQPLNAVEHGSRAADKMAARLGKLHRVKVSSEPVEL